MFNLNFILSPGSCGYFCLRHILKKKIKKEFYLSLHRVKEILSERGYSCLCLKIYDIKFIKKEYLTLVKSSDNSLHYIVVKKVKKGYVYFYDPLFVFVRRKKIANFLQIWSKICLIYTKV